MRLPADFFSGGEDDCLGSTDSLFAAWAHCGGKIAARQLDLGVNDFGKVQKFFLGERGRKKEEEKDNAETLRARRSAEKERRGRGMLLRYREYVGALITGAGTGVPCPTSAEQKKRRSIER